MFLKVTRTYKLLIIYDSEKVHLLQCQIHILREKHINITQHGQWLYTLYINIIKLNNFYWYINGYFLVETSFNLCKHIPCNDHCLKIKYYKIFIFREA